MDYKMNLTQEELDILNGSKGEAMAKVMKTLVMYGDAFGATKMVPVTSKMGHLVTSFGLKVMKPVYDLMDQLNAGCALRPRADQKADEPKRQHYQRAYPAEKLHRLPPIGILYVLFYNTVHKIANITLRFFNLILNIF